MESQVFFSIDWLKEVVNETNIMFTKPKHKFVNQTPSVLKEQFEKALVN